MDAGLKHCTKAFGFLWAELDVELIEGMPRISMIAFRQSLQRRQRSLLPKMKKRIPSFIFEPQLDVADPLKIRILGKPKN